MKAMKVVMHYIVYISEIRADSCSGREKHSNLSNQSTPLVCSIFRATPHEGHSRPANSR
jgi:hypothetical protein